MSLAASIGLAVMVASQAATIARIEPFWSWNTPIAWTGFILFADAVVWRARGNSWIRSNGREFVVLALVSIPLWLVFEGYNLIIRNWYYTGLPANRVLRLFGYAWSFATIWPAIFEGAELVAILRAGRAEKPGARSYVAPSYVVSGFSRTRPALVVAIGVVLLITPFVVPAPARVYMAAPVWLGFIFLLDPLNAWLGTESLLVDLESGRADRMLNLAFSGLLCGVLWEFWNYWAGAKWHYTVPIMEDLKIFEMPVPGYLGFPAFAIECFTMYVFVRAAFLRIASASAPSLSRLRRRDAQLVRTIAL